MPDSSNPVATINMVYLARLREAFGQSSEALPLPVGAPVSVSQLLARLRERGGAWARELAPGRAVRVAVNHQMTTPDARVGAGDEVALFPPVTGG